MYLGRTFLRQGTSIICTFVTHQQYTVHTVQVHRIMRTDVNCEFVFPLLFINYFFLFIFIINEPFVRDLLLFLSMPNPMQRYSALIMCKMHYSVLYSV